MKNLSRCENEEKFDWEQKRERAQGKRSTNE